ncbi:hypothetical protein [Paraflavitalea speifideaquila]|uniref:hypothetical protein n=1 Tax=Paraflavitalea speifideaquila TaxID=3076558 RepID=UPI0028E2F67A|nr:hypothetical protein [Paraflavitalea speifideiaquila]
MIGGTAQYTNINASVSGGTAAVQYLAGATYNRQTTVFPGDFDDKKAQFTLILTAVLLIKSSKCNCPAIICMTGIISREQI